ncbi:MAG: 7-carboxy-7-deazaguanine synthase QueE [Phycisphaerales bacterium]|nr:7-carboxy-7-deazaguanine synthase QueE [Phycisphaerales bacterium]
MRIAEVFESVQGEGKWLGTPSLFIRTSGCNLRCSWCDTPYASWRPEGGEMSVSELLRLAGESRSLHVVITGGEPLIQPSDQIRELTDGLRRLGKVITVETAGTVWQDLPMELASISPKLANSAPNATGPSGLSGKMVELHEQRRINLDILRRFARAETIKDRQWKFVVAAPSDLDEVEALLARIEGVLPSDVFLMPEGRSMEELRPRGAWIAAECIRRGYRYGHRLQIELFGNTRGT